MDACDACGLSLGNHDVGDAASVFMIFLFGATCVPLAWVMELIWQPPMWFQALFWGIFMLCLIAVILPATKAYVILLEFRHKKGG